jgi:hypothetical protein
MNFEVTFSCDWCERKIVQKVLDSPPQREGIPTPPFRRLPRIDSKSDRLADWNENLCEDCEKEYVAGIDAARQKCKGIRKNEKIEIDPFRFGSDDRTRIARGP